LLIRLLAKNGDAQCANVAAALSGTFAGSLSSGLMIAYRAPSRCILQFGRGSIGPTNRPVRI